jgi:hypothetical protein
MRTVEWHRTLNTRPETDKSNLTGLGLEGPIMVYSRRRTTVLYGNYSYESRPIEDPQAELTAKADGPSPGLMIPSVSRAHVRREEPTQTSGRSYTGRNTPEKLPAKLTDKKRQRERKDTRQSSDAVVVRIRQR